MHDRIRPCLACRVEPNRLRIMIDISLLAVHNMRIGYKMLEILLYKIAELEKICRRAKTRELKCEEEVRRFDAGDPTFSAPLATLKNPTSWIHVRAMFSDTYETEIRVPYEVFSYLRFRERFENLFDWLQIVTRCPEHYLKQEAESRGFHGERYDELAQTFKDQVKGDAYFIAWVLDESATLVQRLETLMAEATNASKAAESHVLSLL